MPDAVSVRAAAAALFILSVAFTKGDPTVANSASKPIRIVVFDDNLAAAYGLASGEAFPAQLQAALRAKNYSVTLADIGVFGDTSASGLAGATRRAGRHRPCHCGARRKRHFQKHPTEHH